MDRVAVGVNQGRRSQRIIWANLSDIKEDRSG